MRGSGTLSAPGQTCSHFERVSLCLGASVVIGHDFAVAGLVGLPVGGIIYHEHHVRMAVIELLECVFVPTFRLAFWIECETRNRLEVGLTINGRQCGIETIESLATLRDRKCQD